MHIETVTAAVQHSIGRELRRSQAGFGAFYTLNLRALPWPWHAGTVTHVHFIDEEMEVYVFCDLAEATASPGLASAGEAWGRGVQGRAWAGPNESSVLVLLGEVRPRIASVCLRGAGNTLPPGGRMERTLGWESGPE